MIVLLKEFLEKYYFEKNLQTTKTYKIDSKYQLLLLQPTFFFIFIFVIIFLKGEETRFDDLLHVRHQDFRAKEKGLPFLPA